MPESRSDWRAPGMRASAKAKRSRTTTGEERWLRPMTTRGMRPKSWVMQRRQDVSAPEREQDEDEAVDRPQCKSPATLRKHPPHHHEAQVEQPDHDGPHDLWVAPVGLAALPGPRGDADRKS